MSIRKLTAAAAAVLLLTGCDPVDTGGGGGNPPPPAPAAPEPGQGPPDYIMEVRVQDGDDKPAQGRRMTCTITGYSGDDKVVTITDARTGKTFPYVIQTAAHTDREGTRRLGFFTYGAPTLAKIMAYCRVIGAEKDLVNCEWWDNRTGNSARLLDEQESQQFIRRGGNWTGVCFAMVDVA